MGVSTKNSLIFQNSAIEKCKLDSMPVASSDWDQLVKVVEVWQNVAKVKEQQAKTQDEKDLFWASGSVCSSVINWLTLGPKDSTVLKVLDTREAVQGVLVGTVTESSMYVEDILSNPINLRSFLNASEEGSVQGAGASLIRKVEETAKDLGKDSVVLESSTPAIGFYLKQGYSHVGYVEMKKLLNSEQELPDLSSKEDPLKEAWEGIHTYSFRNGDSYEGNFYQGRMHGHGVLTYQSGDRYEGEFTHGAMTGKGVYTFPDGSKCEAMWHDRIQEGRGSYSWGLKNPSAGSVYEGEWVRGARTGTGTYTWADGAHYQGDFVNGLRTGNGKMTFADGGVYEGGWLNEKRHGQGKMTDPNGTVFEGTFVEDVYQPKSLG